MLINEEIHAAFAGLRTAVEKSEEAVKVIQQVEQAKLREAVRAEAEATKMAELAALETKAATLEAEAAREAQHLAEARSDRLTEKLQNKREEVRKLDELLEKFEDKLQEKRREAKAMEEYVDKLEALLQKEKRGGTGGTKTGSQPAAARASSPQQAENYDQESYVSRSRTPSPAGPDRTQDDSARDGTDRVTKTDWDRAGNEQRPIPGMKAASEHEDSECEICKREDSVPRPAGSKDQESGTGCSREGCGEKEQEPPSGEAHEEVGPGGGATTAVWAAALAVKRMSAHRGGKGEALHGVQTVRAAGRVSNVALDGEMVTIESRIAVAAVLHQVHAGVAHVADSGIVATAGHRTARTAASGVTASQEGARTVGNEATCDDPAAPRATAGGARPAVVGATAGAHDVMTKGAERSASRPAVWAPDVIEAALLEAGATVATTEGHQGAPAAPVTDTPVDARARAVVKTTCAFTTSWTSAAKVTTATTATLTSLR
eukprot:CAMPEP_0172673628 /NCGR_PEP_ID=MMETSP1074-20121228/12258_1 /TAXON_ID=2916 /ORGANISM="Ceratium fusus, Strain PA161109" /LENGTH=489 /DNA_ID=CAMNT_0013490949 /DNA_START=130 /DNA_END=1600 /DNA_ORIENTATION=+